MKHSRERDHDDWMDQALTERLLDGDDIAAADPRLADLAHLLTLAAEPLPATPAAELAALTAFRQAWNGELAEGSRGRHASDGRLGTGTPHAPHPRRPPDGHSGGGVRPAPDRRARRRPGLRLGPGAGPGRWTRRSRSAKAAVIGGMAAVFALGGVAIAAQTGTLPHPFRSGAAAPKQAPATTAPSSGAPTGTARTHQPPGSPATGSSPAHRPAPRPSSPPAAVPPGPSTAGAPTAPAVSASPSVHSPAVLKSLCASYVKAVTHGEALAPAAEAPLEQAAGGKDKVPVYCARLTGTVVVGIQATATATVGLPPPAPTGVPTAER